MVKSIRRIFGESFLYALPSGIISTAFLAAKDSAIRSLIHSTPFYTSFISELKDPYNTITFVGGYCAAYLTIFALNFNENYKISITERDKEMEKDEEHLS